MSSGGQTGQSACLLEGSAFKMEGLEELCLCLPNYSKVSSCTLYKCSYWLKGCLYVLAVVLFCCFSQPKYRLYAKLRLIFLACFVLFVRGGDILWWGKKSDCWVASLLVLYDC